MMALRISDLGTTLHIFLWRIDEIILQLSSNTHHLFYWLKWNDPIRLEFELIWAFVPVLNTCKFGKDPNKNDWERWRHHFPIYKSMGAFGCQDNQFYPICPKTKRSLSPTPLILDIKFDPTGLEDIHVWKCKYIRTSFLALITGPPNQIFSEFCKDEIFKS